jgi:hypothetical protein
MDGQGMKRTRVVARASSLQSLKDSAAGWILLAFWGLLDHLERSRHSLTDTGVNYHLVLVYLSVQSSVK